jgi:hypothetical protein
MDDNKVAGPAAGETTDGPYRVIGIVADIHNALKSSGTSPIFRNTVASLKSPLGLTIMADSETAK